MKIMETRISKFRSITGAVCAEPKQDFFCTVSKDGIQFWHIGQLLKAAEEAKDDMLLSYVPDRVIKLNQMILCCSITQIVDTQQVKVVKKKKNGKVVEKKVEKK